LPGPAQVGPFSSPDERGRTRSLTGSRNVPDRLRTQDLPADAAAHNRAAPTTAVPWPSLSSTMASPTLIPTRSATTSALTGPDRDASAPPATIGQCLRRRPRRVALSPVA
jgi:hypothetical protein